MYTEETLEYAVNKGKECAFGNATLSKIKRSGNKYALIDGMNLALLRKERGKGKLENIVRVYDILRDTYDNVEIFVDASIRYRINDINELDRLIEEDIIFLCPAAITADEVIWKRAISLCSEKCAVTIVTNDLFPTRMHNSNFLKLKNITVSILPTDDIYLIERDLMRFEKNASKPQFNSKVILPDKAF